MGYAQFSVGFAQLVMGFAHLLTGFADEPRKLCGVARR
jgi:hypothetical protein